MCVFTLFVANQFMPEPISRFMLLLVLTFDAIAVFSPGFVHESPCKDLIGDILFSLIKAQIARLRLFVLEPWPPTCCQSVDVAVLPAEEGREWR